MMNTSSDVRRQSLSLLVALTSEAIDMTASVSNVIDRLLQRGSKVLASHNAGRADAESLESIEADLKSAVQPGGIQDGTWSSSLCVD